MWQLDFVGFFDIFRIKKYDKGVLLQSVTGCYFKVGQVLQRRRLYYKVHLALQSVTFITQWDVAPS